MTFSVSNTFYLTNSFTRLGYGGSHQSTLRPLAPGWRGSNPCSALLSELADAVLGHMSLHAVPGTTTTGSEDQGHFVPNRVELFESPSVAVHMQQGWQKSKSGSGGSNACSCQREPKSQQPPWQDLAVGPVPPAS